MWEDEAAARVARVAERLARSQSRLSSLPPGSVASRPSSYTSAGTSRAASEASYASSEILPAEGPGSQAPSTHSAHSGRSAQSVAQLPLGGHGGAARPEQLQRAAARVQSGSPRRSSARARGSFAVKVDACWRRRGLWAVLPGSTCMPLVAAHAGTEAGRASCDMPPPGWLAD